MAPRDVSTPEAAPASAPAKVADPTPEKSAATASDVDTDNLDTIFAALKTLMTTVDKLQKSRQEVGDIKPLIIRMLDGELLSGDELDQLKTGVSGLSKLVKIYTDYQTALEKAQPAREILDTVLK
ncbi:MAG: hypothetical protein AAF821_20555 [Cyanobacteria bacterium P01_D01_bin.156]